MGCPCLKKESNDDSTNYKKFITHERRVEMYNLIQFESQFFYPEHPVICSCLNMIAEYNRLIGEPSPLPTRKRRFNIYDEFTRDDIFYVASLLEKIKLWINCYNTDLSLAFIQHLKCLYFTDYKSVLEGDKSI